MELDLRQREEIFLTTAQSIFALVVIANFRFSVLEAMLLFVLFAAQLFFTSAEARWAYAGLYILLSIGFIVRSADTRRAVMHLLPGRLGRAG
jgi:cation:H+ antiporter